MDSFINDNIESAESEESESVVVLESSQRKRKRRGKEKADVSDDSDNRKRSKYHAHFVKSEIKDKKQCKYCKHLIKYVSGNGTTALKSYTERCKLFPANLDKKQKLINFESQTVINGDGTTEVVSVPRLWQHDQNFSRKECAAMLIIDELPFAHVEGEGFRRLMKAVQPEFIPPSRATATRDCYALYIDERVKLKEFFSKLTSRVCLTTDTWTSGQNLSYMCLTAHFIDDSWTLHKRIINFCQVAGHSGEIIGRTIEQCLLECNLKKVLTLTNLCPCVAKTLDNIRGDAAEKSDRRFAKKLKFYSKVKENVALLNATKTIGKKSRNARKRQKTLKAYDLTELAEILRELPTRRKRPVPLPKPGKKCKSRQTLVLKEANRLQTVLSSPTFQSDPLAAIFQHLQSTQPAPEAKPKKKV